jgi:vacuolar-type H+-ATPase subunit C/Vma6
MGQYAQAEIEVRFTDEVKAEEFANIIRNFKEELKKRFVAKGKDADFDVNIDSVDQDDVANVRIVLDSSRVQNAEWQCDQISDIAKEEFKEFIVDFDATITTPYGYIFWDTDDLDLDEQ